RRRQELANGCILTGNLFFQSFHEVLHIHSGQATASATMDRRSTMVTGTVVMLSRAMVFKQGNSVAGGILLSTPPTFRFTPSAGDATGSRNGAMCIRTKPEKGALRKRHNVD